VAIVIRDSQKAKELWSPVYKAWFPQGLDDPDLALLKVKVESVEYWDTPSNKMVQLFGFVKATLTGKGYQEEGTDHKKLDIAG
jgi:general stress protein 26